MNKCRVEWSVKDQMWVITDGYSEYGNRWHDKEKAQKQCDVYNNVSNYPNFIKMIKF